MGDFEVFDTSSSDRVGDFVEIAKQFYAVTGKEDDTLRTPVVEYIINRIAKLRDSEEFVSLLKEVPAIAVDLVGRLAEYAPPIPPDIEEEEYM